MPTHALTTPLTPVPARPGKSYTKILWMIFGIVVVLIWGGLSLYNHSVLPWMWLHSAIDRSNDIQTGRNAIHEAIGEVFQEDAKTIAQQVRARQISDPASLKNALDPKVENTKAMQSAALGNNSSNGGSNPSPAPTCNQNPINEASGAIQLEIQPACQAGYRPSLYRQRETKQFTVVVVPLDNRPAPATSFLKINGDAANYDATTNTLNAEWMDRYDLQESGRHLIIRLIPKN